MAQYQNIMVSVTQNVTSFSLSSNPAWSDPKHGSYNSPYLVP